MKIHATSSKKLAKLMQQVEHALEGPVENYDYIQDLLDQIKNQIALCAASKAQLAAP